MTRPRDLPGFETNYEVSIRFYKNEQLIYVDQERFIFEINAVNDARDFLRHVDNPCNISVRGPNGRFIKWKNKLP